MNVPALFACYNIKLHHYLHRRTPDTSLSYQPRSRDAIKDFPFKDFNARYAPLCMS